MTTLPIIDLADFNTGNDSTRKAIAAEVFFACHEIGFMYLKNFGIDQVLIAETFQRSQQFFDLPLVEKQQLAWSDKLSNRGYVGIERERLDENKPGDLKEAYNLGKELNLKHLSTTQQVADSSFCQSMRKFFAVCSDAATLVARVMATALDLPEAFFVERHNQQDFTLRLLHYPPVKQFPKPGQLRAGEHSDYGSFTLLFQDNVGGLEVLNTSGNWNAAPTIPDTVIVNTGDLMQRWTNRVFCSTKHRVRIPTDKDAKRSRYAIAFFCHPNFDTKISCLKTCQSAENPPLYAPITAGEYLLSRLQATY